VNAAVDLVRDEEQSFIESGVHWRQAGFQRGLALECCVHRHRCCAAQAGDEQRLPVRAVAGDLRRSGIPSSGTFAAIAKLDVSISTSAGSSSSITTRILPSGESQGPQSACGVATCCTSLRPARTDLHAVRRDVRGKIDFGHMSASFEIDNRQQMARVGTAPVMPGPRHPRELVRDAFEVAENQLSSRSRAD
jgi:hypothetical protein